MKLEITQNVFMKYWTMAERVTGTKSTMATLASILCEADENGVTLNATDLKTTIRIKAEGVNVLEPGTAILPLKVVGELFKKIAVSPFTVEVQDEKGTITAGRSHYSFTTYMVADFPELPSPRAAEEFTRVPAGELGRVLAEGSIAGAPNEDFPKYLSGGLLQISGGELRVVATDGRRLSLSKTLVQNSGEADELREGGVVNSRLDASIPSNWDVIGKFPYTFGVFGHATSCIDIRAEYPRIEREWAKCKDDPFCQGYIWWGETEHCDILWYEYFSKNVWSPKYKVEELISGFCRDRYGDQAAKLEPVWRKMLPISQGHGYGNLFANVLPTVPKTLEKEKSFRTFPWRTCLNDSPAVFRGLADVEWTDAKVKRDTIDIARTVADRVMYALISKLRVSLQAWRKGADNAADIKKYLAAMKSLADAFADTLALHTDYSLWESFVRLDEVEKIRNPNFPRTLLDNAINDYCLGYQYEAAEYWYKPVTCDVDASVRALLDAGDRKSTLAIPQTNYREWMLGTPLKQMAPTMPRTPENYRKTMLKLAKAVEIVCPHAPDADETIHFDGMDEFFN